MAFSMALSARNIPPALVSNDVDVAGDADADVLDEAFAWAALDAAGLQGGFREAVVAAGGPMVVLRAGNVAAFSSPRRRHHVLPLEVVAERIMRLSPWLRAGMHIVAAGDALSRFAVHPACALYGFGSPLPAATRPVIAIVGSRAVGPAMASRTRQMAARLAGDGAVIVSGGAVGVDTAAAVGARSVSGDVVIIDGRPLQGVVSIPREVENDPGVCWLTPYAPWCSGVAKGRFAQRNAFIAAMADVVVAVCGGDASGTRHTVDAALRFGRPVVALRPDADDDPLAALSRRLVDSGAGVVVDDDVSVAALVAMAVPEGAHAAWERAGVEGERPSVAAPRRRAQTPTQRTLMLDPSSPPPSSSTLPEPPSCAATAAPPSAEPSHVLVRLLAARGPMSIDAAAAALDTSVRALLVDVAGLEMDGALRREGALLQLATSHPEG
jgi:DNA processing protein